MKNILKNNHNHISKQALRMQQVLKAITIVFG